MGRSTPLALLLLPLITMAQQGQPAGQPDQQHSSLPAVTCTAQQTGGFHDYPDGEEAYEPALFHPQTFSLEENPVFMMNLATQEGNADLYLTMTRQLPTQQVDGEAMDTTELECRRVRGANASVGYSCVNLPPSEMLLINARSLRFTRTSVGGWTFAGASDAHSGDSIFVEYGQCEPVAP
jgi:hypothetical protein